jgi:putative ABC transport system permease protein
MTPALLRAMQEMDPNLALGEVISMREQVERTMAPQRVALLMSGVFAGLALALAAIGLYAVVSYTVSQSRHELGLRMALGARPSDLIRLVVTQGMTLTAIGLLLGLVVALVSSRLLGYLLYRVSPRDPLAFLFAFVVIALATLLACSVPAWRAAHTDPLSALRD